jgi:LPS-assembly lipoprotein
MTGFRIQDSGFRKGERQAACLLAMLCLLTACGFHSVYGTRTTGDGAPVSDELNRVAIDNIPDQAGQELRNNLIDAMYGKGRPAQPAYHLKVTVVTGEEYLGLLANATSTLSEVTSNADYTLTDARGKVLLHGTARSVTNYDLFNDQYGTLAAKNSAIARNMSELGEQLVGRLGLYFSERPAETPDSAEPAAPVPVQVLY